MLDHKRIFFFENWQWEFKDVLLYSLNEAVLKCHLKKHGTWLLFESSVWLCRGHHFPVRASSTSCSCWESPTSAFSRRPLHCNTHTQYSTPLWSGTIHLTIIRCGGRALIQLQNYKPVPSWLHIHTCCIWASVREWQSRKLKTTCL